eukprot:2725871-Prymnesium_polylepis.1
MKLELATSPPGPPHAHPHPLVWQPLGSCVHPSGGWPARKRLRHRVAQGLLPPILPLKSPQDDRKLSSDRNVLWSIGVLARMVDVSLDARLGNHHAPILPLSRGDTLALWEAGHVRRLNGRPRGLWCIHCGAWHLACAESTRKILQLVRRSAHRLGRAAGRAASAQARPVRRNKLPVARACSNRMICFRRRLQA